MSRYRKTMREALEEVYASDFNEGKMKDVYTMQQSGATAREIADKMKLPLKVVKDILGEDSINEKFTKKDFDRNEDENEHTKNSYELAKMFGDTSEKSRMTRLYNKTRKVGSFLTKAENDFVTMIQSKYYRRLREELELDELQNYSRQLKDPSKEMLVVDKDGKVSVIDKSEFEKYKRQGFMAAEDIGEDGPCWKTHKQVGMKKKNGRMVPNCVPKEEVEEGFSSDAQRRAAFASGYKEKGKDKKEELDKDDKPLVKKVADMLKKASKKHASQSKMLDKAVNVADLTDKQVKMVRKVADKLPKDDFKKRYGKDADNVKFGTATNIVKKKLNIDGYEGARNLVDRLLKQERGDE